MRFEYAGESMKEIMEAGSGTAGEGGDTPGSGSRAAPIPIYSYMKSEPYWTMKRA